MRLLKKIANVKSFISDFYIYEGNIFNIVTEQKFENIKKQNEVLSFGEHIITKDIISGNSNIIDIKNNIVNGLFKIDAVNYPYFTFYEYDESDKEGVFDYSCQKILFETKDWIGRNIIENYIFTDDLICRDIKTGNVLWQRDLGIKYNYFKEADYQGEPPVEVQAKVIKFLGVYKDELWLVLNSGLLALDIKTGKETRYIKEGKMAFGEPFFEDFKGYFGYDTVLDEEKGIIFNLNLHFYIEYDLNSNKNYFDSYSFKESSQKNGLVLNYIGGYDAENIYAYEGSKNNRFAIFSRDKKEIISSGEILEAKDKFPAIRDLQYGAGKLYVLDHYNTLHVFEEEEIDRN
ncbi:hypothetical protein ACILE9_07125 [Capnocytophaga cynodegmi]|uniref:hypothetical protein n=1 Tax=Capnocytophaga cynodegmi TaxID=28189 RepID=UPI0037D3DE2A